MVRFVRHSRVPRPQVTSVHRVPWRRFKAVLALGVASLVLLTGCGHLAHDVDEGGSGSEAGTWVRKACEAVDSVAQVANQRRELDWAQVTDHDTAAALVTHLKHVSAQLDTAHQAVDRLGAPRVANGDDARSTVLQSFTDRQEAVEKSIDFIEGAASRVDPLAPAQIAGAAQTAYKAAPMIGRQIERQKELRDFYQVEPTCTDL